MKMTSVKKIKIMKAATVRAPLQVIAAATIAPLKMGHVKGMAMDMAMALPKVGMTVPWQAQAILVISTISAMSLAMPMAMGISMATDISPTHKTTQ